MPRRYSITEARASLPAIVNQAESGQEIELTRRGKPVAVVMSLSEFTRLRSDRPCFADAYKRFVDAYVLDEVGVDEGYFEAARDSDGGRKIVL